MKEAEKELLEDFVDWARNCGEDAFYIFDNTEKVIEEFIQQRNN